MYWHKKSRLQAAFFRACPIKYVKAEVAYLGVILEAAGGSNAVALWPSDGFESAQEMRDGGNAWLNRFRRLSRGDEQLLTTATAMTKMAFMMILLNHI